MEGAPRESRRRVVGNAPLGGSPSRPPDGYSFVEFHGEMSKSRIKNRKRERGGDGLEWVGAPTSVDALIAQAANAGRDWSFGWIRLAEDARADDLAWALRGMGAEIVGTAGTLIRARLPGDETQLRAIAALSVVDGLGAAPAGFKLQALTAEVSELPGHEQIPVFVTLMTGDPDGRWRRALEQLGAVVGRFDPAIRVYPANATYSTLEAIAMADFVMSIEPVGVVEAAHDTAVPAMGADALRMYAPSLGAFSGVGGATVPIAVMDTGLNVNHLDISSNRSSICGANFVYFEPRVDEQDLWVDAGNHGTHVTGTIVGNGAAELRYAGVAPTVRHIRFAKVLSHRGFGNDFFILRGMDFLARSTACPEAGWSRDSAKPLIVNMSLSASGRVWEGRGVSERKVDSIVWGHRQLYVVAQSNEGIRGFSNYGAAKNSLAVGAALDGGSLASFSSHGPTRDGRLAPQVVGTGVNLYSAAGNGSRGGYNRFSGTSMASPAVAGVAALLMDAVPAHREQPALVRARLMASAIRPDAWLENPAAFPMDNSNGPGTLQVQYGVGKVSARTSVLNNDESNGWKSGSVISELEDGEYAYVDINVPEGTSRLDLVLTWDEPPTDTLASAVLNDLDLWLDHGGDCETEPCGEHASMSPVDNVEWLIVRNPASGRYRAKVAATRVYSDAPRAALAWTVIRGASTPTLQIAVDRDILEVEHRFQERELTLTLTADEYIAAGTRLHIDCRSVNGSACASWRQLRLSTEREDGIVQGTETQLGHSIEIGELAAGETWEANVVFGNLADGDADAFRLYFKASAWNANAASTSVLVRVVDGDDTEVSEAAAPVNDRFENAAALDGDEGTGELDLIHAGTEPGEPVSTPWDGRPARSAWYEWTAPSNDRVSFGVTPDAAYGSADPARVDVFEGDRIAGLKPVASAEWEAQLFAESGQEYRVRISHAARAAPLALNWSLGPRPTNDSFLAATVLEDASGSIEGANSGATLEPGELFGALAGTVWYRWTAPSDGAWKFESSASNLRVLAFVGEHLTDLRLVSGFPQHRAVFPVGQGEVYRIAVASTDARAGTGAFELTWDSVDREPGNDDVSGAEEILSESSAQRVDIDGEATVEPGEPVESGIRTKWWSWTAPEDGDYTWRIEELTRPTVGPDRLMVSVFSGDGVDDLRFVATNGREMSAEFVFSAVADQQYWISVGMPADDQFALSSRTVGVTLAWGPTPANDDYSSATVLSGASGSVTASNLYATTERGERTGLLGHSSLWWTYEAPAVGWYRFWIDGTDTSLALAVYEVGNALGSLELLQASRRPGMEPETVEVVFYAEAGDVHAIRVGTHGGANGEEFTLHWEETDLPVWLRYLGRLAPGGLDPAGEAVELRNLGDVTLRDGGEALYLASELGLQVFARNADTGELTIVQLIESNSLRSAAFIWDRHRDRLLAVNCLNWRAFAAVDGATQELQEDATPTMSGDPPNRCNETDLFMDAEGSFIYVVAAWPNRLQAFAFEHSGDVRHVQTLEIDEMKRAVIANDGGHVYAATNTSLIAFERDAETGELAQVSSQTLSGGSAVAISHDDAHLFAFDDNGARTTVFDLAQDPSNPGLLATLRQAESVMCDEASPRGETAAVDVFCGPGYAFRAQSGAFAVQWHSATGDIVTTDRIFGTDRFNNYVPDFGNPIDMAASPDGRHAYLGTAEHGILIFERVRNEVADVGKADPDG